MVAKVIKILAFFVVPWGAQAQQLPDQIHCHSTSPIWQLDLHSNTGQFRFSDKTINYDIVDQTTAQPGPWPIALTLLADGDTAIVLLRGGAEMTIDILTQRRGVPIVLNGRCADQ